MEGKKLTFPMGVADEPCGIGTGIPLQKGTSMCGEYLIVQPRDAQVIASFPDGTPALLHNKCGAGRTWLFTGQFHNGLFEMKYLDYKNHMMFTLYHAILEQEKVFRPCIYTNSELETGLFEKENGEKLLILINHGPDENYVSVKLDSSLVIHILLYKERVNERTRKD